MGFGQSKPELVTALAEKQVINGNNVIFKCEANTEYITVSWEKDGCKLKCVDGKHHVKQIGKICILEISNAEEPDEGKYTITVTNSYGSDSCFAFLRIKNKEWRTVQWRKNGLINALKTFPICKEVKELRFLLFGPVGAGKSSIINTIRTIFEGRQFVNCLSAVASKSHTLIYEKFIFANEKGSFPFAFNDAMGAEKDEGIQTQDIVNALKGHMKEGYTFNPMTPLSKDSLYYNHNPTLNDQMHCLVCVVPADKISVMTDDFINKINSVRQTASAMGIPQVVFMTRVDCECPLTKQNLQNIYQSKKIREKMKQCSNALGVPMNCIFPILNYHEDTHINEDIESLMLDALKNITDWANDYVVKRSNMKSSDPQSTCE